VLIIIESGKFPFQYFKDCLSKHNNILVLGNIMNIPITKPPRVGTSRNQACWEVENPVEAGSFHLL